MSTGQENIGHYRTSLSKKHGIFKFDPVVDLLLAEDLDDGAHRFRFDREIALLLLLIWSMWPDDDAILRMASRLIADAITFHRRDKSGNITDKRIKKLASIRARLEEPWYETFYLRFYAHFGGLASARLMWTRSDFDKIVVDKQCELNTSLDLIEFLLRMSKVDNKLITRNFGSEFIARDGFQQFDSYGVRIGEKKSERPTKVAVNTVSKRWDNAPATLGLTYIIRQSLPELWSLKMTDRGLLPWLVQYAADRARLKAAFSQYHWLVDHLGEVTQIAKFSNWPTVDDFDQEPLEILPFSPEAEATIASIR